MSGDGETDDDQQFDVQGGKLVRKQPVEDADFEEEMTFND